MRAVRRRKELIWDPWEQHDWLPPPEEPVDEWAERTIRLPRGVSSIAGPLSLDVTPYLRGVLQAITDPDVEEITFCTSTQVGKTTALLVALLYYVANDPWNSIFVMPTIEQARELKLERIVPIVNETPELRALIKDRGKGQLSGDTLRLNEVTVTFRGANSASGLASKPTKIAVLDEIDKWPDWTGKEADPVSLVRERTKTFADSKVIKCSTPTTNSGRVWTELARSTNERYHVPCPHCGGYQELVFGRGEGGPGIKWPKDCSITEIEQNTLAWYECARCGEKIHERDKREMVASGRWVPQGMRVDAGDLVGEAPAQHHRGFHLWSGYSCWPKVTWSRIAAEWLRSKPSEEKKQNFINSWLAEPVSVVVHKLRDQHIRDCQQEYWVGEIPESADAVTFGIDVQAIGARTYHFFVVRAWAPGGRSWLVRYGTTQGWDGLNSIVLDSDYGRCRKICPVVDSGFRTSEVYAWCFKHHGIAYKGDSRMSRHFRLADIPIEPESNDLVQFLQVDPNYFKTELHRQIRSGRWSIPRQVDEEYVSHMVAEQLTRRRDKKTGRDILEWQLETAGLPNHYFDCEVMALVGAEMAGLVQRKLESEVEESEPAPKVETTDYLEELAQQVGGIVKVFT